MARNVLNLEQVVRDWAWGEYDATATASQKKLRRKDKREPRKYLRLELDWSETTFCDETRWKPLCSDEADSVTSNSTHGSAVRQDVPASSGDHRASVLFQTRFKNNTKADQSYTMRTEKKTKTSMTTSIEHGFTKGIEMGVKLMTPGEVFEANVGYKRELTLTNVEGETFEEELTWGVDSEISVKAGYMAEASLVVDERKQAGDFIVVTRIRGPVYVTFTSPRDNNSLVKGSCNYVAKILKEFVKVERRKGRQVDFVQFSEDDDNFVVIETKGTCKFRYGVKQEISVNQKPLDGAGL